MLVPTPENQGRQESASTQARLQELGYVECPRRYDNLAYGGGRAAGSLHRIRWLPVMY